MFGCVHVFCFGPFVFCLWCVWRVPTAVKPRISRSTPRCHATIVQIALLHSSVASRKKEQRAARCCAPTRGTRGRKSTYPPFIFRALTFPPLIHAHPRCVVLAEFAVFICSCPLAAIFNRSQPSRTVLLPLVRNACGL